MSPMLDETLSLLRTRPPSLTYRRIAHDTGLPIHWLHLLGKANGVSDPGVRRVDTLHRYLLQKARVAPSCTEQVCA